jgi:hypothetical protein
LGNFFWLVSGALAKRSNVKSAILPDSTVSGGFWEERNAKVTKTIKIHMEWTVSDCSHVEIPKQGEKTSPYLSISRGRTGYEEEEKIIAQSKSFRQCFLLILCSSKLGWA